MLHIELNSIGAAQYDPHGIFSMNSAPVKREAARVDAERGTKPTLQRLHSCHRLASATRPNSRKLRRPLNSKDRLISRLVCVWLDARSPCWDLAASNLVDRALCGLMVTAKRHKRSHKRLIPFPNAAHTAHRLHRICKFSICSARVTAHAFAVKLGRYLESRR